MFSPLGNIWESNMISKYVTNNNHRNENMMGYSLYTLDGVNNHLLGYNGYIIRINMDIA